jgi:hypothetical protein
MKHVVLGLILLISFPVYSQDSKSVTNNAARVVSKDRIQTRPAIYIPPRLAMPRVTAGPGTRGHARGGFELFLLSPNHVGQTQQEQPVLYWFQAGPPSGPLEFTLVTKGRPDPLLRVAPQEGEEEGPIRKLDLQKHGVRLKPGLEYRWSVAVVIDPEHRSKDIVATGSILRITPGAAATAGLDLSDDGLRAAAEGGLWYDAFQIAFELSQRDPEDRSRRQQLAALSRQIELRQVEGYFETAK